MSKNIKNQLEMRFDSEHEIERLYELIYKLEERIDELEEDNGDHRHQLEDLELSIKVLEGDNHTQYCELSDAISETESLAQVGIDEAEEVNYNHKILKETVEELESKFKTLEDDMSDIILTGASE